jgi:hypothetical protein
MVLVVVRQEGLTALTVARDAQEESGSDFSQPRDLLKNRKSDSLKNSQLTFSRRNMKKGDIDDDADDDDEVRTTVSSQSCATATLSTEELFLRTQYLLYNSRHISAVRCGGNRK